MSSKNEKLFDSFEQAGIHGVNNRSENQKVTCPECSDERKNKSDKCLSVSAKKGTWNCHHCGWSGGIKNPDFKPMEQKVYVKPENKSLPFSGATKKWFNDRGIEDRVLEYFKVGEQRRGDATWISFPYYRDKELVNIKWRNRAEKDFRLMPKAELVFFNLDSIKDKKEVTIVEGEIDAMALYQAGVFSVLSVPNGASKGSLQLEYLDNCWDAFDHVEKIILFTDNDEPGLRLREELARRLGRDRCVIVEYPEACKDANEVLVSHGSKGLSDVVRNAKPYPIEDISVPSDYLEQVLYYHRHGFPTGDKVGFAEFDDHMSFRPGELTVVTGIPNSGKSNFVDQILIRLSSRHGWKHGILSREQWPHSIYVTKLTQIFTGKGLRSREMTEQMIINSNKFLNQHFFLFGIADMTLTGIIEKARRLVLQHGIKCLVIDPWNTLTHDRTGSSSETEYVNEVLKKLCEFKDLYSVHIILVAHPKKIMMEGKEGAKKYATPTPYDISGSSHFFNMADNCLTPYRNLGTNSGKAGGLGDTVTVNQQKCRNFFIGKQGSVLFDYNVRAGTYAEESQPFECEYDRWMHETKQTQAAPIPISFPSSPPALTDINKLPVNNSFDLQPNAYEAVF